MTISEIKKLFENADIKALPGLIAEFESDDRPEHPENAEAPMLTTLSGMMMDNKFVHPLNA